jgi:hypothetical protein
MASEIAISVQSGDALRTECDVLPLKYAQGLYAVDEQTVSALEGAGIAVRPLFPKQDEFLLIPTKGAVTADHILFVEVSTLRQFDYAGIRAFAMRTLAVLARGTTVHEASHHDSSRCRLWAG